jgi:protein-tyrosine phosphatase
VIDIHCHILPGLDDGPPKMDVAVAMARAAVAGGTRTVVATPHVSPRYPNRAAIIVASARLLDATLQRLEIPLRVLPGAEVAAEMLVDLNDDEVRALTLGGGPYVLLESPLRGASGDIAPLVRLAQQRGFRVVLAHPERSPLFQRDPDQLADLAASGVLLSVTARALSGAFGKPPRKLAERMLADGLIHNVSSDMHDLERRPPGLSDGLADAGHAGEVVVQHLPWLADAVPEALLAGTGLPPMPAALAGAGRSRRWFR